MAEGEIPVFVDGVQVGIAKDLGDGTIEVEMILDHEATHRIRQGQLRGLSISKDGLGNIELV